MRCARGLRPPPSRSQPIGGDPQLPRLPLPLEGDPSPVGQCLFRNGQGSCQCLWKNRHGPFRGWEWAGVRGTRYAVIAGSPPPGPEWCPGERRGALSKQEPDADLACRTRLFERAGGARGVTAGEAPPLTLDGARDQSLQLKLLNQAIFPGSVRCQPLREEKPDADAASRSRRHCRLPTLFDLAAKGGREETPSRTPRHPSRREFRPLSPRGGP